MTPVKSRPGPEMTQYGDPPLLIAALMAPEISGALR